MKSFSWTFDHYNHSVTDAPLEERENIKVGVQKYQWSTQDNHISKGGVSAHRALHKVGIAVNGNIILT